MPFKDMFLLQCVSYVVFKKNSQGRRRVDGGGVHIKGVLTNVLIITGYQTRRLCLGCYVCISYLGSKCLNFTLGLYDFERIYE